MINTDLKSETSKDKLQQVLNHTFEGMIWSMKVDNAQPLLALEIRQPENKQCCFACINLQTMRVCFEGMSLENPWLCGMEIMSDGILLLHLYSNLSSPEHSGLIAINAHVGKILWEDYTLAYEGDDEAGFIAYNTRIEPRRYQRIDKQTGTILEQLDGRLAIRMNTTNDLALSHSVKNKTTKAGLPLSSPSAIEEYLEVEGKKIRSHIQRNGETYCNYIRVFNQEAELDWEDIIWENTSPKAPAAFFSCKKTLVYIKEGKEIVCYSL